MTPASPSPLSENADLAFRGETPWAPAAITASQAHTLEAARNPTGRPNGDVLRRMIGYQDERIQEHWQVDFPPHFTAQEAALYLEPSRLLRSRLTAAAGPWWQNPQTQPALRTALARLERFLVSPRSKRAPNWAWQTSDLLPDESLLVVARDDDFTHGLLQSHIFQLWWAEYSPRLSPPAILAAFPFPWPPATWLSSLSREQEELRLALARAARSTDQEQVNSAATAAYGWPADLPADELLAHLTVLNRQRPPASL